MNTPMTVPRWAKLLLITVVLLATLVAVIMLVSGGHSPMRHGGDISPSNVSPSGHMPPPGVHD